MGGNLEKDGYEIKTSLGLTLNTLIAVVGNVINVKSNPLISQVKKTQVDWKPLFNSDLDKKEA